MAKIAKEIVMLTPEQEEYQKRRLRKRNEKLSEGLAVLAKPSAGRGSDVAPGSPLSAVPIIQCVDLDAAVQFYQELGFLPAYLPGYAVLTNGFAEIHISSVVEVSPIGVVMHVSEIEATRAAIARGTRGSMVSEIEFEGNPEPMISMFTVTDPDGNLIRFVSPAGRQNSN